MKTLESTIKSQTVTMLKETYTLLTKSEAANASMVADLVWDELIERIGVSEGEKFLDEVYA